MAELGAIGNLAHDAFVPAFVQDPLADLRGINHITTPGAVTSTIGGTALVEGAAQAGLEVYLFYRQTMRLAGRTSTDAAGDYTFTEVGAADDYVVMIKAPSASYNEIVARPTT